MALAHGLRYRLCLVFICCFFLMQVSESQTGGSQEDTDGLIGPGEDTEDTRHIQVRANNGVVVPEEPAEEITEEDGGKEEEEIQEKELTKLEEGAGEEGDNGSLAEETKPTKLEEGTGREERDDDKATGEDLEKEPTKLEEGTGKEGDNGRTDETEPTKLEEGIGKEGDNGRTDEKEPTKLEEDAGTEEDSGRAGEEVQETEPTKLGKGNGEEEGDGGKTEEAVRQKELNKPEEGLNEVKGNSGKAEELQENEPTRLEERTVEENEDEAAVDGRRRRSPGTRSAKRWAEKGSVHNRRRKRYILREETKRWTKGILPYVFDPVLDTDAKAEIKATMRLYERHTCFHFVPYNSSTRDLYGLDHDGHLVFTVQPGCLSVVGNTRSVKGQTISCCKREVCVHEVGHSLGLLHEHISPHRASFLQINWQNIRKDMYYNFKIIDDTVAKENQYDISSPMHYFSSAFSKNGRQTITQLMDSPGYRIGGNLFYMLREVSEAHKCAEMVCPNSIPYCFNDGYPSVQGGKCQCACPDGLDPAKRCWTPIRKDKRTAWPGGSYSLLQPRGGCPHGFTEAERTQAAEIGNYRSADFHLAGEVKRGAVQLKFCTLTSGKQTEVEWEPGRYCILRKGGKCPKGFADGSFQFDDAGSSAPEDVSGLPDGTYDKDTSYSFCCRDDGFTMEPLNLPNDKPFVLFRHKTSQCQKVDGMLAVPEYYTLDNAADGEVKVGPIGNAPLVRIWPQRVQTQVYFCYYVPLEQNCGRIILLKRDRPVQNFRSVNYPRNYPNNKECTFIIKSPKGSTIILDFLDFEVEEGSSGCADHVEVRDNLIGQPGAFYCGRRISSSIRSQRNQMMVKFRSGAEGQFKGFNATVRIVQPEAMCYNTEDRGMSYHGHVNYSQHFQPCVAWSDVSHCPHNQYSPSGIETDLSQNHCRNIGDGAAPWCYVDKDTCTRQYCEPCGLTRSYDSLDNCADLISGSPDFCKTDPRAVPSCFRSCQKHFDWLASTPTPVSQVSCSPPAVPDDAKLMTSQPHYAVGEVAVLQCKTGKERLEPRCLSDGTWSSGGYVCGACTSGWTPFSKACYKYQHEPKTYTQAQDFCQREGGTLAPAATPAENYFLISLRHHMRKLWLGMDSKNGTLAWTEGSSVGWTNWEKEVPAGKLKRNMAAVVQGENKDNKWQVVRHGTVYPIFSFVCKTHPADRVLCQDRRSTCEEWLTEDGSMCEKQPDFAWQECPYTCGLCGQPVSCPAPATQEEGVEVVMEPQSRPLTQGQHLHHACRPGYVRTQGHFKRACVRPGRLTGQELVCTEVSKTTSVTSDVVLRSRAKSPESSKTHTGQSPQLKIDRKGEITRWEFFTLNPGQVALQVWRHEDNGAKLTLVGQNIVTVSTGHQQVLEDIPDGQRITVQPGDLLGVWSGSRGSGVPYDICSRDSQGLLLRDRVSEPSSFATGGSYDFVTDKDCKVFSLRAVIGPKK